MSVLNGAELIYRERNRQIRKEGWSAKHDNEHTKGELIVAAEAYAHTALEIQINETFPIKSKPPTNWPWETRWWKPDDDPIRNLVKAGALIAAEIDRLQRKNKLG